jgi:hypothetical protein
MRTAALAALASLAAITVSATPSLSLDRPVRPPAESGAALMRVADLERPLSRRHAHHRHVDTYWHWRYRAHYTRWLHNEYVNAGYPVRHANSRTYVVVVDGCCWRRWHW